MSTNPVVSSGATPLVEKRLVSRTTELLVLAALSILLCAILWTEVIRGAVNVLFSDQWQTFTPLFDHLSWWETFDKQHGPHRLGLGFVITRVLMEKSNWNINWESYFATACLTVAAAETLWLKARMQMRVDIYDLLPLTLILSPLHYETLLLVPAAYHSTLPLCMLLGLALCMTSQHPLIRYILGAVIAGLSVFTGFGIIGAGIYTLLLLGAVGKQAAHGTFTALLWPCAALVLVGLSWGVFFIGFSASSGIGELHYSNGFVLDLIRYVGLMFAGEFQYVGESYVWLGLLIFCVVCALGILDARRAPQAVQCSQGAQRQVFALLLGTSVTYAVMTAVGRLPLGLQFAQSSRYMALLIPAFIAAHFGLARSKQSYAVIAFRVGLTILLLGRCTELERSHQTVIQGFQRGKHNWVLAYRKSHDINATNEATKFALAGATKERLDFIEKEGLTFFASDKKANRNPSDLPFD